MGLTKKSSKKKILSAWLEALRGQSEVKYKQTTEYLRRKRGPRAQDGFCCLGVLCELAVKAKVIDPPLLADSDDEEYSYSEEVGTLPDEVRMWAGIREDVGRFYGTDNRSETLTNLNDSGASFKKIASIIEKNKKEIFVEGTRF